MQDSALRYLRFFGALLLIAITLWLVDPFVVLDRLLDLRLPWVLLGLSLSVPLHLLLALRWMQIARSVQAPLRYGRAVQDYYLAGFVNQALPTGLAGAALRAMRHSRRLGATGAPIGMSAALSAVILDRISGLAALCLFGFIGAIALGVHYPIAGLVGAASVLAMLVVGTVAFVLARRHARFGKNFVSDAGRALYQGKALWQQALLSSAAVVLLSATFYCAARSAGVHLSFSRTMLMAPLVLGAMAVPLAIAGWGIREATAAALFAALDMAAAAGVAVSVAFGVITLVASAPGLLVWLAPESNAQRPGGDTAQDPT